MSYTVIVDSFGYFDADGALVYATRGQDVELDGAQAKRALDPDVHPPTGAVAEKDSLLAQALRTPIPATANPDAARAHVAALVRAAHGSGGTGLVDPAHVDADKERTGYDASVANSRALAGEPLPGAAVIDYSKLPEHELRLLAEARGLIVPGDADADTVAAILVGSGGNMALSGSAESEVTREAYSPMSQEGADAAKKQNESAAEGAKDAADRANESSDTTGRNKTAGQRSSSRASRSSRGGTKKTAAPRKR